MNKQLGPGALFVLSLILLYLGGVIDGAIGTGLAVGGFVCLVVAVIGLIKKLTGGGQKKRTNEVLNHAKRIESISAQIDKSMSSNSGATSKSDVQLDIIGYCLYITFVKLIDSGYKGKDSMYMIEQLAKHTSFYINHDVAYSGKYTRHFKLLTTELLGIQIPEEEYKAEMEAYLNRNYNLNSETSALINKIDDLLKVQSLINALR